MVSTPEGIEDRLRVKDLPEDERPYERLEKFGANMLSNAELLAIIIKTGTRRETSIDVAKRLLKKDEEGIGLAFLNHISLEELTGIKGIGKVKAIQLKALAELSKRISSTRRGAEVVIKSPEDVSQYLMGEMRCLAQEEFRILLLNTKNCVTKMCTIAVGGLNASYVEAREIFKEPVRTGAASIILVHNHPSGDPSPSRDDILLTRRAAEAGAIMGIKVLDHIVIGGGTYSSLKEEGLF